jgi:hypothetical protein
MSKNAKLEYDDKAYDMPIVEGTFAKTPALSLSTPVT